MKPEVSAFGWVPPFAQGLVRDLRVRWALREAGRDYDELLIGPQGQSSEDYRRLQPFGQVPAYRDEDVTLFESGAIVLHISEPCARLLPIEPTARSRTKTWMFAALNTVEPPILFLNQLQMMKVDDANEIRRAVVGAANRRLGDLAAWLGDRPYLEGEFTAGDLLMTTSRASTRTSIGDEIAHLRGLDLKGLRSRWHSVFQRPPPDHLPRHLLFAIIAYRIQADRLGDLDHETRQVLDRTDAKDTGAKMAARLVSFDQKRTELTPGTVLVREWDRRPQRVMVLTDGFAWNGQTYDSLSKVAFAITGTKWNGPRFFGLRDKDDRSRTDA